MEAGISEGAVATAARCRTAAPLLPRVAGPVQLSNAATRRKAPNGIELFSELRQQFYRAFRARDSEADPPTIRRPSHPGTGDRRIETLPGPGMPFPSPDHPSGH